MQIPLFRRRRGAGRVLRRGPPVRLLFGACLLPVSGGEGGGGSGAPMLPVRSVALPAACLGRRSGGGPHPVVHARKDT
jgi:hypothetical protein